MANKVITPECRLSFPQLFVPKAPEPGKDPVYSATFLFALDADMSELEKAARAAAVEKWGDKAKEMFQRQQLKWPIRDQASKAHLAGYSEGFFISARAAERPGVVDARLNPIMDPAEVFAGMIVRASLNAFAYDHPVGGKGVSFGLNNVMIVRSDGTRFDGRSKAEADFANYASAAGSKPDVPGKDALWED